jgi:flagellar biogenesis protein FliO
MRAEPFAGLLGALCLALWSLAAPAQESPAPAPPAAEETFQPTHEPRLNTLSPTAGEAAPEAGGELDPRDRDKLEAIGARMDGPDAGDAPAYAQGAENIAAEDGENGEDSPLGGFGWQPLLQSLVGLFIVLALILLLAVGYPRFTAWLTRRLGGRSNVLAPGKLGRVVGRIYLDQGARLYLVEAGGRVLVVGTNQHAINLIAEYDAAAFDLEGEGGDEGQVPSSDAAANPAGRASRGKSRGVSFLQELRARSVAMDHSGNDREEGGDEETADPDLSALRDEIRRLQQTLQEGSGEPRG